MLRSITKLFTRRRDYFTITTGDNMQNIFGQNLLNRRKALGLTQEQLAAKLKVSFQAVSK